MIEIKVNNKTKFGKNLMDLVIRSYKNGDGDIEFCDDFFYIEDAVLTREHSKEESKAGWLVKTPTETVEMKLKLLPVNE